MCLSTIIPKLSQTYWNLMSYVLFQSEFDSLAYHVLVGKTVQPLSEESEFEHKIRTVSTLLEYASLQ